MMSGAGNLSNVWDWSFFWDTFGFLLRIVSPFQLIMIAILAVGLLLAVVILAARKTK